MKYLIILILLTSCNTIYESVGTVTKVCQDHSHIKYMGVNNNRSLTIKQSMNQATEVGDKIYCDYKSKL